MGAGSYGNCGNTNGSKSRKSQKKGVLKEQHTTHTKDSLILELDGKTLTSTEIANQIKNKRILINIISDDLFNRYLGYDNSVIAAAYGNKVYLRRSSTGIVSDLVHEGKHALDHIHGIKSSNINTWPGEIRAYKAEREFQIKTKRHVDFPNEADLLVHVWRNYKRED